MKKYFPFLDWLTGYKRDNLGGDISAGLTVGVMLIPQGMAYSMLAGLPPIYGLYASTIPLIIYALLGTSRQLAVGPVAMVALLIASGVSHLAAPGSPDYIQYAIVLALMVGAIQFLMGSFRLGFVVNFLAHPVIAGFTSAAAVIIGFSQIKHLFGLSISGGRVDETLVQLIQNIGDTNIYTLAIGVTSILLLIAIRRWNKKIPGPLLTVLAGMAVVYFLGLFNEGVRIVKDIPGGIPSFSIPVINSEVLLILLPVALTIALVGFMESIAVAKAIQAKHKDYKLDASQELVALGMANIVGSFFKSFPVTGGFSRTAVNDQAGAKTGLASIISAVIILFTLLFLTKYFYYLPTAVLAAIIMVAVFGLIDYKEAKYLWKTNKQDFALFMVTAGATLLVGIEQGILTGVVLSLLALVYRSSRPHIARLGKLESGTFRNVDRFPEAKTSTDRVIIRIDGPLFFGNIGYLQERIEEYMDKNPDMECLVIHAGSISTVDSTAAHAISDMVKQLQSNDIRLIFTDVIGPVRDIFKKTGLTEKIGDHNFFTTLEKAEAYLDNECILKEPGVALQSNHH